MPESQDAKATISLGKLRNACFVAMPFSGLFKEEYERVIRPSIEGSGLECIRADEVFSEPGVMDGIWKTLRECRAVVAELSGRNPNVFYELGLAHALGKPVVLVTRDKSDVPFDLSGIRYIYYDQDDPRWGRTLQKSITRALKEILSASEFGSGLAGIALDCKFPKPPTKPILRQPLRTHDVSGSWKGSWVHIHIKKRIPHEFRLTITQTGAQLSGDMSVQYHVRGKPTVVHEVLTGSIEGHRLSLQGVSYSFVIRGNSRHYALDRFDLQYLSARELKGSVHSWPNEPPVGVCLSKDPSPRRSAE